MGAVSGAPEYLTLLEKAKTVFLGYDRLEEDGATVVATFKDGKPTGRPQTVVSGFASKDEKTLMGAPVGMAMDAEGALLVADDVGDVVWRVSAK